MNESALTDVDADMRTGALHRVEKNQIAGSQAIGKDRLPVRHHFVAAPRQLQIGRTAINPLHQAAAVESFVRM